MVSNIEEGEVIVLGIASNEQYFNRFSKTSPKKKFIIMLV